MKSAAAFAILVASASAFVPNAPLPGSTSTRSTAGVTMMVRKKTELTKTIEKAAKKASKAAPTIEAPGNAMEGIVGADIEAPYFDPLNFAKNCPPEQMQWYRAAELKHGRIAMLASLGQIVQSYTHWNDPSGIFDQTDKPWAAMQQVYEQRPWAFIQILLAIFAAEVYGNKQQEMNEQGGNLNFDPLNLKPSNEEAWEKTQLRELKNGRLAMLAIAGMLVQENLSGKGVIELIRSGNISPFDDGIGAF